MGYNSLRSIKKDIEYVIGAFLDDCYVAVAVNPGVDEEKASDLFTEAVALYDELREKASATIEGKAKPYFVALRKELLEKTDELYTKLSDLIKAGKDNK